MSTENDTTRTRPLGVAHLIFGLIFAGIATLWFIGNANGADFDNQAAGLPVVLIGAGVIGLVAAVLSRRRTTRSYAPPLEDTIPEDTIVLDETKDQS